LRRIAFYGKGGIGKSTVSSNISLLFSQSGRKVLQIGADPKHDSSQRHIDADRIITAMDVFSRRSVNDAGEIFKDALMIGRNGVHCIEAGGPEPGTGCAGRSISLLLEMFDLHRDFINSYDVLIYDVLGDVVCGGFATPIRLGHAEELYIITSGEPMSLYAANNIIKGFLNLASSGRIAGIVANLRGAGREAEIIERFSKAVQVPVVAFLERDETHLDAELHGMTAVEMYPDSTAATACRRLFESIDSRLTAPAENPHPLEASSWSDFIKSIRHSGGTER